MTTVQRHTIMLFFFKLLHCDLIKYRDTLCTHIGASMRVSVFDIKKQHIYNISEVLRIYNGDHVFVGPPSSVLIELSW